MVWLCVFCYEEEIIRVQRGREAVGFESSTLQGRKGESIVSLATRQNESKLLLRLVHLARGSPVFKQMIQGETHG